VEAIGTIQFFAIVAAKSESSNHNPKAAHNVFLPHSTFILATTRARESIFTTDLDERLPSQVGSSSLSTVEVAANARRDDDFLWVLVKVGGFDSWLLGDAIGEDEDA